MVLATSPTLAPSDSNFNVALQARTGVIGDGGTASGGSSSLTTASSAAAQPQFASSFIQAFAGEIPTSLVEANN